MVLAILSLKVILKETQKCRKEITIEMLAENPYSYDQIRKTIDTCAFSIYGHWVKRSSVQWENRGAIYENKPKSDLIDEKRCLMTKPSQYKLAFTHQKQISGKK